MFDLGISSKQPDYFYYQDTYLSLFCRYWLKPVPQKSWFTFNWRDVGTPELHFRTISQQQKTKNKKSRGINQVVTLKIIKLGECLIIITSKVLLASFCISIIVWRRNLNESVFVSKGCSQLITWTLFSLTEFLENQKTVLRLTPWTRIYLFI